MVDPLLVFHEVVSQTSEGKILHYETEIPPTWQKSASEHKAKVKQLCGMLKMLIRSDFFEIYEFQPFSGNITVNTDDMGRTSTVPAL